AVPDGEGDLRRDAEHDDVIVVHDRLHVLDVDRPDVAHGARSLRHRAARRVFPPVWRLREHLDHLHDRRERELVLGGRSLHAAVAAAFTPAISAELASTPLVALARLPRLTAVAALASPVTVLVVAHHRVLLLPSSRRLSDAVWFSFTRGADSLVSRR